MRSSLWARLRRLYGALGFSRESALSTEEGAPNAYGQPEIGRKDLSLDQLAYALGLPLGELLDRLGLVPVSGAADESLAFGAIVRRINQTAHLTLEEKGSLVEIVERSDRLLDRTRRRSP